jgi:hypothetical protein
VERQYSGSYQSGACGTVHRVLEGLKPLICSWLVPLLQASVKAFESGKNSGVLCGSEQRRNARRDRDHVAAFTVRTTFVGVATSVSDAGWPVAEGGPSIGVPDSTITSSKITPPSPAWRRASGASRTTAAASTRGADRWLARGATP